MKRNKLYIITLIIAALILLAFIYFFSNTNEKLSETNIESELFSYELFECNNILYDDVERMNNMYYKKIDTLEQYNLYKAKTDFMPECNTNFNERFILMIMVENSSVEHIVPEKIYTENDKLYIGMVKNANINPNYNAFIIEISKNLEKTNIEVYKAINEDIQYENYIPIKELPRNYTIEDAKKDACYIIGNNGEIFNKQLAEQFVDNYSNNKNSFIRVIKCSGEEKTIIDVYYSTIENKFLTCVDNSRIFNDFTYNYYMFSNLDKKTLAVGKDGLCDYYTLTDPYETEMNLFYI
ncbi:MAG: hypothetical protein HFJ38_05895 [Bacilli bacterium]|nr:hypothetical protein [Bacilli bacterium]